MIERYFYSIWTFIFFALWLVLFYLRKDVRKEMLLISFLFGIGGVLSEFIHVQDWWQPITLTGTLIGFEDFFIGMFIGGVAAVIYEEVYKKRVKRKKGKHPFFIWKMLTFFVVGVILFYGSFYILNLHSFYALVVASLLMTGYMLIRRRDLIADSLMTGIIMTLVGAATYAVLHFILPGYFHRFWYLGDAWFSSFFLGIPIKEYVWFFLAGAFIGPLYEFWQEGRLIKKK